MWRFSVAPILLMLLYLFSVDLVCDKNTNDYYYCLNFSLRFKAKIRRPSVDFRFHAIVLEIINYFVRKWIFTVSPSGFAAIASLYSADVFIGIPTLRGQTGPDHAHEFHETVRLSRSVDVSMHTVLQR